MFIVNDPFKLGNIIILTNYIDDFTIDLKNLV